MDARVDGWMVGGWLDGLLDWLRALGWVGGGVWVVGQMFGWMVGRTVPLRLPFSVSLLESIRKLILELVGDKSGNWLALGLGVCWHLDRELVARRCQYHPASYLQHLAAKASPLVSAAVCNAAACTLRLPKHTKPLVFVAFCGARGCHFSSILCLRRRTLMFWHQSE